MLLKSLNIPLMASLRSIVPALNNSQVEWFFCQKFLCVDKWNKIKPLSSYIETKHICHNMMRMKLTHFFENWFWSKLKTYWLFKFESKTYHFISPLILKENEGMQIWIQVPVCKYAWLQIHKMKGSFLWNHENCNKYQFSKIPIFKERAVLHIYSF